MIIIYTQLLTTVIILYRKLRCPWRLAANIWDYTWIGKSGEVTFCCHALRLYWHRLFSSWWLLAVTNWGSGPSDVCQSLAETQVPVTSCSHYLRLCLHRLLRLGWCLAVTNWGYACNRLLRLGWCLAVTNWGYACNRLLRSMWRLAVTIWDYALYRLLKLGRRLAVIVWGYTCQCARYKGLKAWQF